MKIYMERFELNEQKLQKEERSNNTIEIKPQEILQPGKREKYKLCREGATLLGNQVNINQQMQEYKQLENTEYTLESRELQNREIIYENEQLQDNDLSEKKEKVSGIYKKQFISFIANSVGKSIVSKIKNKLPSYVKIVDVSKENTDNEHTLPLSKEEGNKFLASYISDVIKKYISR